MKRIEKRRNGKGGEGRENSFLTLGQKEGASYGKSKKFFEERGGKSELGEKRRSIRGAR